MFAAFTVNVCDPTARPLYAAGLEHAVARAPSSEQVVLVGAPVVVHANEAVVAIVDEAGVEVRVTVGFAAVAVTVQPYEAEPAPALLAALTVNVCGPTPRPL